MHLHHEPLLVEPGERDNVPGGQLQWAFEPGNSPLLGVCLRREEELTHQAVEVLLYNVTAGLVRHGELGIDEQGEGEESSV